MTLASLSQLTNRVSSPSEYVASSDEAEAARYSAYVEGIGLGDEIIPDEDLRELEARL